MTEEEIKNLIEDHITSALAYVNDEVSAERETALDYYLRKPYGNEVSGKSKIVTGEVAEAVDGALPQLMKVFTQSSDAVDFLPVGDGDADVADTITQYVNHVFNKMNDGASIFHNWFWDALVQKNGVVKAYWDENIKTTTESYEGLSIDELTQLTQDENVEIVSQEILEVPVGTVDNVANMTNEVGSLHQDVPEPILMYNVTLKTTVDDSKVKIVNVAPEEFLINDRATAIADASFVAQRSIVTRAELVEMGYDRKIIDDLAGDDVSYVTDYNRRDSVSGFDEDSNNADKTQQLIAYYECYLDVGNDKGEAEKRRICYAGKTILADEECDYVPFHGICPFPIPHQFYGQSLADRTMDLQFIKSTVTRQMLDNLYLTNNSRVGVVEGQVNLDDVLNSTAGGVIRMKNPAAIVPLTVQSSAGQSFPMLEYLDGVQAKRTGVSDMSQGLDDNVLQNVSATAVATMTAQSQGKLELMARTFADTGVRSLFQGILQLVCKYQTQPVIMKIDNKNTPIDPREWDSQYHVTINVGLGNGSKDEQVAMLGMLLAKQEMILTQYGMSNPLVTIKQYRETLAKMINASGYKDDVQFIKEITDEESQQFAQQSAESQNQPPPEVQAAEAIANAEREKAQMKQQTDMAAQALKMKEAQFKVEMEQQELALKQQKQQVDAAQSLLDIETERAKLEADIRIRELELALKNKDINSRNESDDIRTVVSAVEKMANVQSS